MDYTLLFRGVPSRLLVLEPAPDFRVVEATEAWLRSRRLARPAVVGRKLFELVKEGPEGAALRVSLARVTASRVADEINAPVFASDGSLAYIVHRDHATEVDLLASAHERDQAIRELQKAKQELEAFAYSASHDLRAPLRAIGGYCALLRNLEPGMLPPIAHDLLAKMDAGVRNMTGIIEGLLTLTNVDMSRMTRARVDISALARRVAHELQHHDTHRVVSICVADDLSASADPSLVSIALENLIGNAWKYTRKVDEARIEIGKRKVAGRDVFYVRDNGAGFDMARAAKLFTPFVRFHGANEFEGHGIGLATVRRVVERHGGEIWAESQPGRGTTMNFTLG